MTNLWCQACGRGMEGIPALLRHQAAVHGRGPVMLEPEEPEYVVVDLEHLIPGWQGRSSG